MAAAVEATVEDQAGTDPGADGEHEGVVAASGGAEPPFGDRGGIRVVFGEHRQPNARRHLVGHPRLAPRQVRREPDSGAVTGQKTRDREPDAGHRPPGTQFADQPIQTVFERIGGARRHCT